MHARKSSKLPLCVACLFRCGWGIKRVMRHTGFAKTTIGRFMRLHGLSDEQKAKEKKEAFNARKTAAATGGIKEAKRMRAAEIRALKAMGPHLPKLTPMQRYYANHEENKRKAAEIARARYNRIKSDPARIHESYCIWVASRNLFPSLQPVGSATVRTALKNA